MTETTAAPELKNVMGMRIVGAILILFSIIEFGIGGAAYGYLTNVHLGAWWAAVCTLICGFCGVASNSRGTVIAGLVFSIFAIIISLVGAIVDGISAAVFVAETGCVNTDTFALYGTSAGQSDAIACAYGFYNYYAETADTVKAAVGKGTEAFYNLYYNRPYSNNNNFFYNHPNWAFYYNVNHFYNWYQTHNTYYWNSNHNNANNNNNNNNFYNYNFYNNNNNNNNFYNNNNNYNFYTNSYLYYNNQCVCADGSLCYGYNLASGNNCGSILTTYTQMLQASTAFCVFLLLLSFTYSILTCIACNGSAAGAAAPTAGATAAAPVVVVLQGNPTAANPVHVQPGVPVVTGSAVEATDGNKAL